MFTIFTFSVDIVWADDIVDKSQAIKVFTVHLFWICLLHFYREK